MGRRRSPSQSALNRRLFLINPDNQDVLLEIEDVARSTGQSLEIAKARNPDDLEPAFAQLVSAQVGRGTGQQ